MENKNFKSLKDKLENRNKGLKEKLIQKHKEAFFWAQDNTKQLSAGIMGSLLLLTAPVANYLPSHQNNATQEQFVNVPESLFVVSDIKPYLPETVAPLTNGQEERISQILSSYYGFTVAPEINGIRLNTTYGYIGLEQHLKRYQGDSMEERILENPSNIRFAANGIAPRRGGFGYFAQSKDALTQKDSDREKYYIAVQTFLAPGFAANRKAFIDFFKFRKMIVVNPSNGRAIVADIADAGPAVWTGKQLGGSPEVMDYLGRVDGKNRGDVLYFFIDDPTDSVSLGPVVPLKKEI